MILGFRGFMGRTLECQKDSNLKRDGNWVGTGGLCLGFKVSW